MTVGVNAVKGTGYYLRHGSGCGGGGAAAYYTAGGEPPGEWYFPLRNDLGVEGEIHTEGPTAEVFRTAVDQLCHPVTGEPLGSAAPQYRSVEERVEAFKKKHPDAVQEQIDAYEIKTAQDKRSGQHAWDITFNLPKSWGVLQAALEKEGRYEEAEELGAAGREGVLAALQVVAEKLTYTRRGASGPKVNGRTTTKYMRERNIQMAIFRHHVSRERDPHLHWHAMMLNRILCDDGQWRAIETGELFKSKHLLDVVFLRSAEARATRRLGARFAWSPDSKAREIVGVGAEVRDLFSSRRRALSAKAQEMVDAFTATKGRAPTDLETWRMNQRATFNTRKPKGKTPPSREEELDRWEQETAAAFREGFQAVCEEFDLATDEPVPAVDFDPDVVIALALDDLSERKDGKSHSKAVWNRSQLMHAIDKYLPAMLGLELDAVVALLEELTDAALQSRQVVSLVAPAVVAVPESLTDEQTGRSVFESPTGDWFTSKVHLEREDSLVSWLGHTGSSALSGEDAARVLAGRGLSDEQFEVATSVLTSDRAVELVNAGAGTGKSRLMAALSDAAEDVWGHGLTGLTTAENAAQVLAREGVHRAHNIAAFLDFRSRERRGEVSDVERATFAIPAGGTVVIDEASMVSTPDLVALRRELEELGAGRVVLIGDTAQVDAVDAGGAFALLCGQRAPHTLTQVRRFVNEWERDASARLRDGDLTALTQYDARARIRGGDPDDVAQQVVDAFVTDHLSGRESVVVVGSSKVAQDLSSHIRQRLVEAGHVTAEGVALHDLNLAGPGDLVQTRRNDRRVGVVNREVWQVVSADEAAGTLTVRPHGEGRVNEPLTLPASYVAEYIDLAYASTVEAVQGRTTDTGHLLVDEMMGRSRAYPGLTRGRESNTAWVSITPPVRQYREPDAEYDARIPSALSAMIGAFEREDHTDAALTVIEAEQDRATNLGHLGPQWQQLVVEHRATDHRQVLRAVVGTDRHALFMDMSLDGLLHLMRSAESHGYDVREVVGRAYGSAKLEGARSPASMLYARLDALLKKPETRPLAQVERAESYAERTPAGTDDEITYAREVAQVMDTRVAELGEQAAVEPPDWALALLGPVPAEPLARADWSEKAGVVVGYREQYGWGSTRDPVGPAPSRAEPEKRWAWSRASSALGVEADRDVVTASDGDLANRVLAWRRENETMPRNVDDDLREAHTAAGEARAQVVRARTRGEDPTSHVADLTAMEARIGRLELVASARVKEVERTAPERDKAQEALVEMERRVKRDEAVMARAAARHAADDRDAREAADRDAKVQTAVGERFNGQYVRDAPVFGSQRWAELDDDDAAKRSGLFTAALGWWRSGAPRDEQELTDRLERHGADVAPERTLTARGLERVRAGEDEEQVRATEPSGELEVLAEVHRFTSRDLEGEAPEFGSLGYAEADDDAKRKAETRGALRGYNAGDSLDERAARADALDDRESAAAISKDMQEQRHPFDNRTHAQVLKARGEEPAEREPEVKAEPKVEKPEPVRDEPKRQEPVERTPDPVPEPDEPKRVDTSWTREATEAAREPERALEPKRDDLAEQVQRAREAVERMKQEETTREAAPQQREPEVPVRQDVER